MANAQQFTVYSIVILKWLCFLISVGKLYEAAYNEEDCSSCLLVKSVCFHFYCLFSTRLKQQYPVVFQDICLYSEVSHRMGSATYRLSARRFLQELFLDLQFDAVSTVFQTLLVSNIFMHVHTYPSSTTCQFSWHKHTIPYPNSQAGRPLFAVPIKCVRGVPIILVQSPVSTAWGCTFLWWQWMLSVNTWAYILHQVQKIWVVEPCNLLKNALWNYFYPSCNLCFVCCGCSSQCSIFKISCWSLDSKN